jgi:hypothetical protein
MDRGKSEAEADAIIGLVRLKRMVDSNASTHMGYQFRTPGQNLVLAKVFGITIYPSCRTRKDLAILLNMPPRSVQIWFQNSRQSLRYSLSKGKARTACGCARGRASTQKRPGEWDSRSSEIKPDMLLKMVVDAYKSIQPP